MCFLDRIWCWLGLHKMYGDTVLRNIGTDETPIYLSETTVRCNFCNYTERKF